MTNLPIVEIYYDIMQLLHEYKSQHNVSSLLSG